MLKSKQVIDRMAFCIYYELRSPMLSSKLLVFELLQIYQYWKPFIILTMKTKMNKEKIPSVLGSPKNGAASFKKQLDPKAGLGKAKSSLIACKSSQNLKIREKKRPDISLDLPDDSLTQDPNSEVKQIKFKEPKVQEAKVMMGAKSSQISVKSASNIAWKSRNTADNKEEDKTQKFVNDREEKMNKLADKNLELEEMITMMKKEKQKTDEILQSYKLENQKLEAKLDNFKKAASDNRRLIKERAEAYKDNGNQILNLKKQIEEMKASKAQCVAEKQRKILSEYGVQTQIEQISGEQNGPDKSQNEMEKYNVSMLNHSFSNEQYEHITHQISQYYEAKLKEKQILLEEQRDMLHEQNIELNELYEKLQDSREEKLTQSTNIYDVQQIKQYTVVKNCLHDQIAQNQQLEGQIQELSQEISRLNMTLQTKQIYIKHLTDVETHTTHNQYQTIKSEYTLIKEQLKKKQNELAEKSRQIKQLLQKVSQQDAIMKNLRQSKPKVIIK